VAGVLPLDQRFTVRRLLAALVLPALLLAGCSDPPDEPAQSSSSVAVTSDVEEVEVTGEPGEKPTVSFDGEFQASETERTIISEGDGPVVELGQKVSINYLGVNGRDGTEFDTSFGKPEPASFLLEQGQLIDGFIAGLEGVKVGSRVLVGITPEDGYGEGGQESAGIEGEDSLLFVIDVLGTTDVLERATGEVVPPVQGLPTVVLGEDGAPTVTVPEGPPPTELIIQPLITGTGAPVAAGQNLTVHYHLVNWESGEVVESSWTTGAPVPLPVGSGQVMPALDAGLVGQPVGSQVMLVVPPAVASEGAPTPVTETLIFVLDILDAE